MQSELHNSNRNPPASNPQSNLSTRPTTPSKQDRRRASEPAQSVAGSGRGGGGNAGMPAARMTRYNSCSSVKHPNASAGIDDFLLPDEVVHFMARQVRLNNYSLRGMDSFVITAVTLST